MKKKDFLETLLGADNPIDIYKIDSEFSLRFFVEDIERVIRSSREYKGWVYVNKAKNKLSKDSVTGFDAYEHNLTVEMHHVIHLYDIVYTTGLSMIQKLKEGEFLLTYDIASQVMQDHLNGIIPIIPLSKTYHQLVHEGLHQYKIEDIHGNYQEWLDKYKEVINEHNINKFKELLLKN